MSTAVNQNFFEKLTNRVLACGSLLCVGLDPHSSELKENSASAARTFCLNIIQKTAPFAAAFKPNAAFFEKFGAAGSEALKEVIEAIPEEIPVILDAKRGDISTTATAYAESAYSIYNADSVTLSPYMGWNSISPFVTGPYQDRGAFVLCKTSNPSSSDLQDCVFENGEKVYEKVARCVSCWNRELSSNTGSSFPALGMVAGATDLAALAAVRRLASFYNNFPELSPTQTPTHLNSKQP